MTEINRQLLADLARIATRYPADDWLRLADWLEDERRRAQVGALLRELAATSRSTAARRSKPRHRGGAVRGASRLPQLRASLAATRETDPARADLLDDIWAKLRQRELLPTMDAMRGFADLLGLKRLNSPKREQAVAEIMEQLVEMPSDKLEQLMQQTVVTDRELGEEYERWVRLILRRRQTDDVAARGEAGELGQGGARESPTDASIDDPQRRVSAE